MGKFKLRQPPRPQVRAKTPEEILAVLKKDLPARGAEYREQSIRIHGLFCAKCGRDFDASTRHLLTVHHKDGNHNNNPPDGSNWENLCIDCHDDEHSRDVLADYLRGGHK